MRFSSSRNFDRSPPNDCQTCSRKTRQFKRHRTVHKMKMPKCGGCVYLFPNVADARNRRIQQSELFDLGGKLRGISIGHHHPNVVTDEIDIFVPEALNQLMDIGGGSFLVIASFFSG